MASKLRFGLIGCGVVAPTHAKVLAKCQDAELVAVCDINEERARKLAADFNVPEVYTDYQEMLQKDYIDAVTICTPHYLHAQMCIDAAAARKHVLVEKPMAIHPEDCDAMIAACERAKVRLGVCFQHRFNEATLRIKEALEGNQLGRLIFSAAEVHWYRTQEYYDGDAWRGFWATEGGGVLINQAIHSLDLMLHLLGPVEGVVADIATLSHKIEVEDTAAVMLHFTSGVKGVFSATNCAFPGFAQRLQLYGEQGSIVVEGTAIKEWIVNRDGEVVRVDLLHSEPEKYLGKRYYGASHGPLIEEFVEAVLADRDPYVSGIEGKKSIEVLAAVYKSARSGEYIRIA